MDSQKIPGLKQNWTPIPNIFFDEIMSELTGSELMIFLAICRKTIGWHKETDDISGSQLAEITGLHRGTVVSSANSLEDKKIIKVIRDQGRSNTYKPIFHLSEKATPPVGKSDTHLSENPTHKRKTKESTKETLSKRARAKEIPPDRDTVYDYFKERLGNGVRAEAETDKWFDHYSACGWKVGKNKMKDWQAAVRQWCRRIDDFNPKSKHRKNGKPGNDEIVRNATKNLDGLFRDS